MKMPTKKPTKQPTDPTKKPTDPVRVANAARARGYMRVKYGISSPEILVPLRQALTAAKLKRSIFEANVAGLAPADRDALAGLLMRGDTK